MLIHDLAAVFSEENLHKYVHIFNAPLPTQWLEDATNLTAKVSIRRRKLPPSAYYYL
jgi:hypothetical protein